MNTAILIWAYLALGDFLAIAGILTTVGGIVYGVVYLTTGIVSDWGASDNKYRESEARVHNSLARYTKAIAIWVGILIILFSLYPSKGDLKFIIGGALVVEATQIDGINELPENLVNAANAFLEEVIEEK